MKVGLTLMCLLFSTAGLFAQQRSITVSTEGEIKADVETVPCKGRKERRDEVVRLFKKMGASDTEVSIEKIGDVENVVAIKKGKTDETVIVGAHYDKTDTGCGAIDNWTGIAIIANLYRTLRSIATEKTYKFVAFDKEERGLLGSDAMARKIPKDKRDLQCAMVNFDSFGFALPQALKNITSKSLMELAKGVSGEMKIEFANAGIDVASSDSRSFLNIGIPAITFHGLSNNWQTFLHTSNDQLTNVNIQSVYIAYRHGVVFLLKIEKLPCGEFRQPKSGRKQ